MEETHWRWQSCHISVGQTTWELGGLKPHLVREQIGCGCRVRENSLRKRWQKCGLGMIWSGGEKKGALVFQKRSQLEIVAFRSLTDIQVPDIQLSDTQVPDTQAPGRPGPQTSRSFGHPGPWTSRSLDIQVFRTSRSFGRPGPWTSKSPDVQVFRTSRSRKSNAHTLILDWCAFALDGVKNVTDGPTDKAFLGVGYNFKPNIDQNLLNCLW